MTENVNVVNDSNNVEDERIPKIIFVTPDTEVVSISSIRRIPYTAEEKKEYDIKDIDYTLVHAGCFAVKEADGYDAITGNSFILNEDGDWELIESEVDTEEDLES